MGEHWLVIDTASRTGRVGLVRDGVVVGSATLDASRRHARDLTPAAAALLKSASIRAPGLTGIVVSIGPGSFTGLRVGITAAKALSYATGCALVAVPTFAAIANRAPAEAANLWVIADALQGQVYLQRYLGAEPADALRIVSAAEVLPTAPAEVVFSGPGVPEAFADRALPAELREPTVESLFAAARGVAPLTRPELFALEPLYLRGSSAEEAAKARDGH